MDGLADGHAESDSRAEPMTPGGLAGRVVGGFVLESLLGAGGMAEVYRGIDLVLAREVAVKVLPPQLAQFPISVARFRDEARAVAALASPHIVPIYQYGEDDNLLYLVMPILADSLRAKLQREGPPPIETAVRLVAQIAGALEIAHAAGVVHRDVKPENILLDAHNQPMLSDFGIARDIADLHAAGAGRALTTTGTLIGTPQYMAPEQLRQQPADQRSDVYSLGVVLYELLTGRLPHAAPTPYEVVASVLTQPVEPPSAHNPGVWPALDVVALTALAKEPATRYLGARDFERALHDALASDRGQPRGAPAAAGTISPEAARLTRPAASPTATTVPARATAQSTVRRPRRKVRPLTLAGLAAALVALLVLAGTLTLSGGAGAPGLVLLPLPGLAASRPSSTPTGSPSGPGTAGATTTTGGTPTSAPTGPPAPTSSPSTSPTPTGTPQSPSLSISPISWQLATSRSSSDCTSVPSDTGYTTVSQTITNNSGGPVSWQWQNPSPALPDSFQYQLNGGLWSLPGALPADGLLGAGATATLNVRLPCSGTQYLVTLAARTTLSQTTASYAIALRVPGLP